MPTINNPGIYNPGSSFTRTSDFGVPRPTPNNPNATHSGVDFFAQPGTPIPSASGGEVIYSGFNPSGYGNTVIVKTSLSDGTFYYSQYSHMNGDGMPNVGDTIVEGETLGHVGNTGSTQGPTGNHLHFQLYTWDPSTGVPAPQCSPDYEGNGGRIMQDRSQLPRYIEDPNVFNKWENGSPYGSTIPLQVSSNNTGPEDFVASDGTITVRNVTANPDGTTTDDRIRFNADGSTREDLLHFLADGTIQNEEIINTSANGFVRATVSGQGANVNLSNAQITVQPGTQATIKGDGSYVLGLPNSTVQTTTFPTTLVTSMTNSTLVATTGMQLTNLGSNNNLVLGPRTTVDMQGNENIIIWAVAREMELNGEGSMDRPMVDTFGQNPCEVALVAD